MRPLKIAIPPRAGHFSTLHPLASLQRRNSRSALRQSSLRALRCGGRGPRKISNARFRDPIFKGLVSSFVLLLLAVTICFPAVSSSAEMIATQVVEAEGSAPIIGLDLARARDEAIRDALLKAVVQVANRFLDPRDAERRSQLLKEKIYSQADGFIQDYRLLFEASVMDVYTVATRVTVFADGISSELQRLGLIRSNQYNLASAGISLTVRGIRSYGDYTRCYGILKDRISGIRASVPREVSWGQANFFVTAEGTIPAVAERLREKLAGEIQRQDDRSLEIHLK
jgi:hypothetical protein